MTDNENKPAAVLSIAEDKEFQRLFYESAAAHSDAHRCSGDFGTGRKAYIAYDAFAEFLDAKLTQARDTGHEEGWVACCEAEDIEALRARTEKAEAQLAAILTGKECNTDTLECLGEIFSDTERPDKITVRIDDATNSLHVHYEDLDEEWLYEVRESLEKHE